MRIKSLPSLAALLSAIFLTLANLNAQTKPPLARPPLTFRTLGADCAPEGLNFLSGSNVISLSVLQGMRSQPQSYTGGSPMILFRIVTGKDGKPTQVPVAAVDLSQGGTFPLLVFLKGPKGVEQPLVQVLKEDSVSYPNGTYRFVNDTKTPLEVNFSGLKFPVLPYGSVDKKGTNLVVQVGISTVDSSGRHLIENSNVGLVPTRRMLLIAVPSEIPGHPLEIQRHNDSASDL